MVVAMVVVVGVSMVLGYSGAVVFMVVAVVFIVLGCSHGYGFCVLAVETADVMELADCGLEFLGLRTHCWLQYKKICICLCKS